MKLKFNQVDVFTSVPFMGNPVAVIFDADDLSEYEMQQIANWTNLSETTFVQSSMVGDYKLRIFTPRNELKFAGHPTLGTAFALIESGKLDVEKKEYIQDCQAGFVHIRYENGVVFARVPAITSLDKIIDSSDVEGAIGVPITSKPLAIDSGPVWLTFSVANKDVLNQISIDVQKTLTLSKFAGISGLNVYCIDDNKEVHLRTFAPILGVPEDPVCGSGNAAVAAHLKISGKSELVGEKYTAYQGSAMGRNGIIQVIYDNDDIYIGGKSVVVINGTMKIK